MRFSGKSIVVTSAGSGWARAIAVRLAREGANVIVLDAEAGAAQDTCEEIRGTGGKARGYGVDIADLKALQKLVSAELTDLPSIDGLLTSYMAMDWTSVENCDIDEFARVVQYDLVGPVAATKAFLPLLKASGRAAIVHLSSIDGINGSPRVPSYSAAKGGLLSLTRVMAFEFAGYNIRVNAIATGQTVQIPESEMPTNDSLGFPGFPGAQFMRQLNEATPLKRHGPLTDWAGSAAFLLSDDADYVTGSVLVVDCGRLAITPGTH